MAASGINEHHEACRKQNYINRQTFKKKLLMEQLGGKLDENPQLLEQDIQRRMGNTPGHLGPLSAYDVEKLHKKHAASATDEERRRAVRQLQYCNYSAKINGRLSSTNYTQQW